jgi:hypothetical protein
MMQYLTGDHLPSTPHKVDLNTRERYAFAYFHEPNFNAVVKPLREYNHINASGIPASGIHYGTHFTNMFMRNYPKRITAQRVVAENRMAILNKLATESANGAAHVVRPEISELHNGSAFGLPLTAVPLSKHLT